MALVYQCIVYTKFVDPMSGAGMDLEEEINELFNGWRREGTSGLMGAYPMMTDNGITIEFPMLRAASETDAAMTALELVNRTIEAIEQTLEVKFQPVAEETIDVHHITQSCTVGV